MTSTVRSYEETVRKLLNTPSLTDMELSGVENPVFSKPNSLEFSKEVYPLGNAFLAHMNLARVSVYLISINLSFARELCHGWKDNDTLNLIRLTHSTIHPGIGVRLASVLGTMRSVEDFAVWSCIIGEADLFALMNAAALLEVKRFRFASSSKRLMNPPAKGFSSLLLKNISLGSLILQGLISDKHFPSSLKLISHCDNLETLTLTNSVLADKGAYFLFKGLNESLERNERLIRLSINSCQLTEVSGYLLCQYPKLCSWLNVLNLGSNKLGVVGNKCITDVLAKSELLHYLTMLGDKTDPSFARFLDLAVRVNDSLLSLTFTYRSFHNGTKYISWRTILILAELSSSKPLLKMQGY